MENKKFYGEKIAFYRDKLRYNRQEFIDQLNSRLGTKYSAQALYSWEKCKAIPPADLIPSIARLLQISILEFFGEDAVKTNEELEEMNKKLIHENKSLKQENEHLKGENKKLEGKVEASTEFVKEIMKQQEQRMRKS